MRIGIDLDDTICRTTEMVHKKLEEYSKEKNLEILDIMNDEVLKQKFFDKYMEDIYKNAEVKRNVGKVLKRLRSKGNELYIITARSDDFAKMKKKVYDITKDWLDKNDIVVDGIIVSAYGDEKGLICRKNKIDLMIDDDPYNYKKVASKGIKCLLFDDRGKYDMRKDYVTTWLEIEKYIERNR